MSVDEVYAGQMADMRRAGYTLQKIGDEFGITREGVRQHLKKYHPNVKRGLLVRNQVAKLLGCSNYRLKGLERRGILKPDQTGFLHLYDKEDIEKAKLSLKCLYCGAPIEKGQSKYCMKCGTEKKRYSYPFMSEEQKQKHIEATIAWQRRNPERTRKSNESAMLKYNEKKRGLIGDD